MISKNKDHLDGTNNLKNFLCEVTKKTPPITPSLTVLILLSNFVTFSEAKILLLTLLIALDHFFCLCPMTLIHLLDFHLLKSGSYHL